MCSKERTNLRRFHNWVKDQMLQQVCKPLRSSRYLMDFGSGMGGDVLKWKRSHIDYVIGIDKSKDSIEEAKKRCKEHDIFSDFLHMELSNPLLEKSIMSIVQKEDKPKQLSKYYCFDIVSCHFVIHYFFQNKYCLYNLFYMASRWLKRGGCFLITCPNGDYVHQLLENGDIDDDLLFLKKLYKDPKGYGKRYAFGLKDTPFFMEHIGLEYLVDIDILMEAAQAWGFNLIRKDDFKEWNALWEKVNPSKYTLDDLEKKSSFINTSFIFQKSLATPNHYHEFPSHPVF